MMDESTLEMIRKYAAKNAIDYGSASVETVLKKVISKNPALRGDIKSLSESIRKIVDEVNSSTKEQLEDIYKMHSDEFAKERESKLEETSSANIDVEGAVPGAFATRFPPEPNGPMQLGHAKALFIERELASKYNGKLFLYFDDTNPSKEKQEFVDMFMHDLDWLGVKFDDTYYASDNIETTYKYGKQMLKEGNAYVCWCSPETIKNNRFERKGCVHRNSDPESNVKIFEEMLDGKHDSDGYVIRFKGDMASDNTTMRDPVLFRVMTDTHYRQGDKYHIWPKYEFNTPIMDSIHGVTHTIRSKEFELEEELYYKILDLLGLRKPIIHIISRLKINDNITSKRNIVKLMSEGMISGFDDPRLITIAGLRRRGVSPEAIKSFVLKFGTGKSDRTVGISMLLDENRRLVGKNAIRLQYSTDKGDFVSSGGNPAECMITVPGNLLKDGEFNKESISVLKGFVDLGASKIKIGDMVQLKGVGLAIVDSENPLSFILTSE